MFNGIRVLLKKINRNKNFWTYFFITLTYLILGYQFFNFIIRYTVNILFWDQWDHVKNILFERDFIKLFFTQHNEHRIGTGLIITKILAYFTHWNNLAETIFIGLIIFVSSIFAFFLKKRLFKKIEIYDIIIPFLFLNLYQYENLIWGFQIAFVLPILFFILGLYLVTFSNSIQRNIFLIFFALLSTYSPFHGIFVSIIIGIYFFTNYFIIKENNLRKKYLFFFLITFFIIISYFLDYKHAAHLDRFKNQKIHFRSYLQYMNFQINGFIGNYNYNFYYLIVPFLSVSIFIFNITKIIFKLKEKKDKTITLYFIILSLFLYSFLFLISTAYGRVFLGLNQAYSSRYMTFMIPLYFGIYLTLCTIKSQAFRKTIIPFLIIFFVFFSIQNNYKNYSYVDNIFQLKNNWKTCYLKYEDISKCNQLTGFQIYPNPKATNLKWKLDYLKKNKLNLFNDK